jgi:glucokinase
MYLAADIGGTKTHLALYEQKNKTYTIIKQKKFPSGQYSSLEKIIQEFLSSSEKIEKACFGVAGPIHEERCETPNLAWIIDKKTLQKELKTQKIALINDLVANAYGIKALSEKDFFVLNQGKVYLQNNQTIVSAGTGLGEVGLFFNGQSHQPFASEGGHCDLFLRNKEEIDLFFYLQKKYGEHVSIERVLSGPGLENIYHFLVDTHLYTQPPLEKTKEKSLAQLVSEKALNQECTLCEKALDLFVSFYGAEASNSVLKFYALGGVFLGGGIAPKILEKLKTPVLLVPTRFEGRSRHGNALSPRESGARGGENCRPT